MFDQSKLVNLSPRERWEVLSLAVRQRRKLSEKLPRNQADKEEYEFWNGLCDKMLNHTDQDGTNLIAAYRKGELAPEYLTREEFVKREAEFESHHDA